MLRHSIAVISALAALSFFSGCATTPVIDYDETATAKMAAYKTFTIDSREQRAEYQNIVLSPIVDRRIEAAIIEQLEAKGFVRNESAPDFRITFDTATKTKKRIDNIGVGPTPFRRYPYYGYANYSTYIVEEYEEGSFIIDIIDQPSKELVWRGVYVKELGWSAPDAEAIGKIVSKTLEKFPPEQTP
jgi:hypothetical protein